MNAEDCYVPHPSSGTTRELFFIGPFALSHFRRTKRDLRDPVRCKQFKLGPGDFPRFLWEGETMDSSDPAAGFLRHPILFAVSMPTNFSS